jgi:tetrahydromethanopterin S-methyltransferase subunit E
MRSLWQMIVFLNDSTVCCGEAIGRFLDQSTYLTILLIIPHVFPLSVSVLIWGIVAGVRNTQFRVNFGSPLFQLWLFWSKLRVGLALLSCCFGWFISY